MHSCVSQETCYMTIPAPVRNLDYYYFHNNIWQKQTYK